MPRDDNSVPDETSTEYAATRSRRIDASRPTVPNVSVSRPPYSSAVPPKCADSPASAGNTSVHSRKDRKSTRLNSVTNAQLVCRLLLEKKNLNGRKRITTAADARISATDQ